MENVSYYRSLLPKVLKKIFVVMRITVVLLFLTLFQVVAVEPSYSQSAVVSVKARQIPLVDLFSQIEKQSEFLFFCVDEDVRNVKVDVNATNQPIADVLQKALAGTDLVYTINDRNINIVRKAYADQQRPGKRITGMVLDDYGEPVIGANVSEKGTTNGTITDVNGAFSLTLPSEALLTVSYIGYKPVEMKIDARNSYTITLMEDTETLEEVVVIGYGTARKIDLTGSTSSVGGDKLRMKNTPQLSSQLQGQMAGVQITRSSGDPTAGSTIRVRGVTTMSTNDPLVIVDGVPGDINSIAPEDVKDIQVLKDAASAAIYGSRAAAGVILVTTNRAKNGEFRLSYNAEYGIDAATSVPKFANSTQWMTGYNELAYNDGATSLYSAYSEDLINNYAQLRAEDPDRYPDTDYMGMGIKNSTQHHRHSLSLSGGSDKLKTNFSLNYYNADALYDHKNYERFNVRTNNDYAIASWIHANVDINMLYSKTKTPHNTEGSIVRDFMQRSPIYNSFWSDGSYADGKDGDNPFAMHDMGGLIATDEYRVGGKLQLDFTPVKGLTLTAIAAPQYNFTQKKDHKKKYEVYRITGEPIPGFGTTSTAVSEERDNSSSLTMQFYANYKMQLARHSISLMAGYEDYTHKWEKLGASRSNYSLDNFPYLNLGPQDFQFNKGNAGHNAYRSIFGRVMYSWADRYLLQANIRSDGSSRFADGHRWGTFPSVSAGWVISEESWFNNSVIDVLKLRGSIGQLGNERIGSEFPYQASLSFGTGFLPNVATGLADVVQTAYQMDYAFRTITWETTTTYGIAADLAMLNNRFRASAEYYYKKTSDMLLEVGFPSYFGYNAPQNNAADMTTKGWDLELSWSDRINDFRYGASFNISDYRSKMGYMADRQKMENRKIIEEGSYYNEWYGYKSMGLIQSEADLLDENGNPIALLSKNDKAGNIRYQDIDGDGKITAANDRVLLGNSLPELQYGGSLWAEWKGFDFNLSFQGVGRQLNYWSWPITPFNFQAYGCPLNLIESHWSPMATEAENAKAKYPKLTTNKENVYADSDFYLFDGAYMRIKNITLGYTLPAKITNKFFANKLRVYFSANDLPAFSNYPDGYDPEWNRTNDLIMTSYIFGLNVSF